MTFLKLTSSNTLIISFIEILITIKTFGTVFYLHLHFRVYKEMSQSINILRYFSYQILKW